MHREIEPAIHYWGTPVVLVSTLNEDGSPNISPMSSAWWLGWSCMLGFDASSKTVENLKRERECVLNLASAGNAHAVNRLARTTGTRRPPIHKKMLGYRHVADKAQHAKVTMLPCSEVRAPRVAECLVQLEAEVVSIRSFGRDDPRLAIPACSVEVRIKKVHVDESLVMEPDRIDPVRWQPLLMSFRRLFALGPEVEPSRLAQGDESLYAPWKRGGVTGIVSKALGAVAQRRYGIAENVEAEAEGL